MKITTKERLEISLAYIRSMKGGDEISATTLYDLDMHISKAIDDISSSSPSSIERLRIAEEALNNIKEIVWKSTIINKVVTTKDIRNIMKEITTWSNKQESVQ